MCVLEVGLWLGNMVNYDTLMAKNFPICINMT